MNDAAGDLLLDHFRTPYHRGALSSATHRAQAINPLCGDQIELQLRLSPTGLVELAFFRGQGCAVSQAAASVLCEQIEGVPADVLRRLLPEDILSQLGVQLSPIRQRCALLALEALTSMLAKLPDSGTTASAVGQTP